MLISEELILAGMSERGGWNREQMSLLGVKWPPKEGWKRMVIGQEISNQDAEQFIRLTGKTKRLPKKARSDQYCLRLTESQVMLLLDALKLQIASFRDDDNPDCQDFLGAMESMSRDISKSTGLFSSLEFDV